LDHPNHILFEYVPDFPNVDDHFRWLLHCVIRELQAQALKGALRQLVHRIFQRQCSDTEFATIAGRLEKLGQAERAVIASLVAPSLKLPAATRRRVFESVVGWTWHFVPGLLRELALAQSVGLYRGNGRAFQAKRTWAYYHPWTVCRRS
jgi:hypothetical protein